MNPDLYWIPGPWRGKLAIVTRPRGGDWLEDEAAGWRRAGLNMVVSLLEEEEANQLQLEREKDAAKLSGIDFVSCPIPDRSVPPSTPNVLALLKRITTTLDNGKNVAIHCRQGVGRSGLVAASALVSSGMDAGKATELVSRARGVTVPEIAAQLAWLQTVEAFIPSSSHP